MAVVQPVEVPEPGSGPKVVETHLSVLFFVGDRVYKLRKPVTYGFVDFATRVARQADCQREVTLNRRLAPDVYLGVLDVSLDGDPVDHVVAMRRLPDRCRLATRLTAGGPTDDELRSLARALVAFHGRAERGPAVDAAATPGALARRWAADFADMAPFVGRVLDPGTEGRIRALVPEYLAGRRALLHRRIAEGAVVDGHGDLQADDVFFLEDGPRVLDCLEFDDRLRYGDVAADLAFLVMDLERLGAEPAAARLVAAYQRFAGTQLPPSLLRHYVAARAYVRAKVACLRWAQGETAAAAAAAHLQQVAARHLAASQVRLVLVGGRPGSGKSTVAAGLAGATGAVVLRSDEVRKELAGLSTDTPVSVGWVEGLYRPEHTAETYRTMLTRAETALSQGVSVVLDATWADAGRRAAARRVAAGTRSRMVELRCDVPAPVADARLVARQRDGGDPSDATVAIGRRLAEEADPWPEAVVVGTGSTRRAALAVALRAVGWPASLSPPVPLPAGGVPRPARGLPPLPVTAPAPAGTGRTGGDRP